MVDNKSNSEKIKINLSVKFFTLTEYIYFLDSDDYIRFDALNEVYKISKEKNLDMVLFKLWVYMESTNEFVTSNFWEANHLKSIVDNKVFNYDDLGYHVNDLFACTMQSTFFRAELIKDIRFMEGFIWEDDPFFLEAFFKSKRIYFLDKHLGVKRERINSITHNYFDKFSDCIPTLNKQLEIYKKYGYYDNQFRLELYRKKFHAIKLRFSQIPLEFKEDFFVIFKKDCIAKKEEYEQDDIFKELNTEFREVFYGGLNSKDFIEFEEVLENK